MDNPVTQTEFKEAIELITAELREFRAELHEFKAEVKGRVLKGRE